MNRTLGRRDRVFNAAMPHMSALRHMATALPPLQPSVDWESGQNINWGMMWNDVLGCCTIAGIHHFMQLAAAVGRKTMITEPNSMVLLGYEEFCGYRPSNVANPQPNETDQGGIEQDVLHKWLTLGVPIVEGSHGTQPGRSKIRFVGELDVRNIDDVKRGITDAMAVYIGFNMPAFLMNGEAPEIWDYKASNDNRIVGGHCAIQPGYDQVGLKTVSWGSSKYKMTWEFFEKFVDEAYIVLHPWWFDFTGKTPLGIDIATLSAQASVFARNLTVGGTSTALRR